MNDPKAAAAYHPGDAPVTRLDLDAMREQFANVLQDDVYACTRVWEAWQVGTMTEDDFTPAWENEDILDNLVQVAASALAAERARADQAEHRIADAPHGHDCWLREDPDEGVHPAHRRCTCWKSDAPTAEQGADQ